MVTTHSLPTDGAFAEMLNSFAHRCSAVDRGYHPALPSFLALHPHRHPSHVSIQGKNPSNQGSSSLIKASDEKCKPHEAINRPPENQIGPWHLEIENNQNPFINVKIKLYPESTRHWNPFPTRNASVLGRSSHPTCQPPRPPQNCRSPAPENRDPGIETRFSTQIHPNPPKSREIKVLSDHDRPAPGIRRRHFSLWR